MARKNIKTEAPTLREIALAFDQSAVDTMAAEIEASLDRRHAFELSQGLTLTGATSWEKAKKQAQAAKISLARTFLALNITPANIFERRLVEGKMFNAKSIKKIVELAHFTCGNSSKLELVTRAFVACCIIADSKHPGEPITNAINARFLNSKDLGSWIKDQELLDSIDKQRHKGMSTGADTQSSQARNVLDVLGLGEVTKVERERDAVRIDAAHPMFELFRQEYMHTA